MRHTAGRTGAGDGMLPRAVRGNGRPTGPHHDAHSARRRRSSGAEGKGEHASPANPAVGFLGRSPLTHHPLWIVSQTAGILLANAVRRREQPAQGALTRRRTGGIEPDGRDGARLCGRPDRPRDAELPPAGEFANSIRPDTVGEFTAPAGSGRLAGDGLALGGLSHGPKSAWSGPMPEGKAWHTGCR